MIEPTISRSALFAKLGYEPHSKEQWEAHTTNARFRIPCCGRRWGKSMWAGHELTYKMFVPDSINWIVGPNYSLGEKEFKVVHKDFQNLGLFQHCNIRYNVPQGQMRIYFKPLNSLLEVKSAEKQDGLVGERLNHVCMSEAAKHRMSTWSMYIRPALADTKGTADFPSTPEGFNWYEGMYQLGQSKDDPDYISWSLPSWTNPIVFPGGRDDPEIKEMESTMTRAYFEQEVGAQFTSFEGKMYPDFEDGVHVRELTYRPDWPNYLALDFGFVDPFVCLDIQIDPTTQRTYVWREYQVSGKSTSDHAYQIANRKNPDGYKITAVYGDPRGADQWATLRGIWGGIGEQHAVGNELGIEAIGQALKIRSDGEPGLFIDPSCTDLRRQMRNLRRKEVKEGHNEKPGQHDYDDHGPDALRYFFNEYFILGSYLGISDINDISYRGSEAQSFFNLNTLSNKLGGGAFGNPNRSINPVGGLKF